MTLEPEVSLKLTSSFQVAKLKVLCLSIWYPLTMSRYFEKALRHHSDLDVRTTGPFTGTWIPWMGGMNLLPKYAVPPDLPLPFKPNIGEVNYELVKAQLGDWKPDLVLTIDAGIRWKYKPTDGIVAHVATDPHVLNYDYQRTISDKFFNMQKCYSKGGDIYLPYAYSKYDHYPVDTVSKDVDAVLIGMPYENRVQWVNELRKRDVKVIFENGPVYDEARELYARGNIGLNWSSMNDLNARAFELAAMKIYPVMNEVSDIHLFKLSDHIHHFTDLQGAIDGVMWAKEHPEDAKFCAEMAYEDVQGETYDARVAAILTECNVI